jgi:hypothetical protein
MEGDADLSDYRPMKTTSICGCFCFLLGLGCSSTQQAGPFLLTTGQAKVKEGFASKSPRLARASAPMQKLPASVRVVLYTEEGKPAQFASAVFSAVEQQVTEETGVSAQGATNALLIHLYRQHRGEDAKVKLHPQMIGRFIAQALKRGDARVGPGLVQAYRSGKL